MGAWQPLDVLKLDIKGHPTLSQRERALLNMVAAEKTIKAGSSRDRASIRRAVKTTVADISQNPGRRPFTNAQGVNHTLTTSTVQIHLGKGRLITPREMMMEQGHPSSLVVPEGVSMLALKKLAGEGMSLPCLAVCLWAQFLVKGYPGD